MTRGSRAIGRPSGESQKSLSTLSSPKTGIRKLRLGSLTTSTLKDLIRDYVVEFLKNNDGYMSHVLNDETVANDAEELVTEIMETIKEKILPQLD